MKARELRDLADDALPLSHAVQVETGDPDAAFPYWAFALLIFCNGVGSGLFASPNTSAIMSSVPARHRGAA